MPLLDRYFVLALIRRTSALWAGARMVVAVTLLPQMGPVVQALVHPNALFLLIVPALAGVELQRRREFLFFATLGISRTMLIGMAAAITLLLEVALAVFTALAR